jgi:hypothetical protein
MKNFEHFVLTRFNVKVFSKTGIDSEWLNDRFKLFEQFCYPSLLEQSNQKFKWLVFFDSQTPEVFKEKVREYSKWKNFLPVYVEGEHDYKIYPKAVLNNLKEGTEYLITTRLDNDDALHKDFIKTLQENFNEQEFEFISFLYGYVYHDRKIYLMKYLENPFVSLVERIRGLKIDGFKTAICVRHTELTAAGNVKQIITQPYWLQVVHERNVSNRVRGLRQPIKKLGNNFLINPTVIPTQEDSLSFWIERFLSIPRVSLEQIIMNLPTGTKAVLKNLILKK